MIHHDVTASGKTLLDAAADLVDQVLTESFDPLSPTERDTLRRLLERTVAGWEERAASSTSSPADTGPPPPGSASTAD